MYSMNMKFCNCMYYLEIIFYPHPSRNHNQVFKSMVCLIQQFYIYHTNTLLHYTDDHFKMNRTVSRNVNNSIISILLILTRKQHMFSLMNWRVLWRLHDIITKYICDDDNTDQTHTFNVHFTRYFFCVKE